MTNLNSLFQTIRESMSPSTWSKGVTLSRNGHVYLQSQTHDEWVLRIKDPQKMISPTTTLWIEDEDWRCDCGAEEDLCAHVAAAVIAIKQSGQNQQKLPTIQENYAQIRYALVPEKGFLHLKRFYVEDKLSQPLKYTLTAITEGRVRGPKLNPTKDDWGIDRLLLKRREGCLASYEWAQALAYLKNISQIYFNDEQVICSIQETGMEAILVDDGGAVKLYGAQNEEIEESFRNGVALCQGMVLKRLRQPDLTQAEIEILARGQHFGEKDLIEFISSDLPQLSKKIPVIDRSTKIAQRVYLKPKIKLETSKKGQNLQIRGKIVYGDPAIAEVVDGRLVPLVNGQIPVRQKTEEKKLGHEMIRALGYPLGESFVLQGIEAVEQIEILRQDKQKSKWLDSGDWTDFIKLSPLKGDVDLKKVQGVLSLNLSFFTSDKDASDGKSHVSPSAVFDAYTSGESMVALNGGGWAEIPLNWLQEFGTILQDLLAAQKGKDKEAALPSYMIYDLQMLDKKLNVASVDWGQKIEEFSKAPTDKLAAILSSVDANLRPYQKEGVEWLANMQHNKFGALLADDMGLGKTIQSICVIEKHTLVIAPSSVLFNWEKEINRFRPSLSCQIYHGGQRSLDHECDVVITTYGLLRLEKNLLSKKHWSMVILDESQTIKNPESQTAVAAFALNADFKLSLSGTPVENHLGDLWSQFCFLNPGLLGSWDAFQKRYRRPIEKGDDAIASHLQRRLSPFMKRRLKHEVVSDLPPRTDVLLSCDLSEEEMKLYKALQLATQKDVMEKLESSGNVMQALELLLRLRQAACHPALVPGGAEKVKSKSSAKVRLLIQELSKSIENGHKALVFSQWTSLLDLVEVEMERAKIVWGRIDGSTRDRGKVVENFQKDGSDQQVLLLSLKAAGVGLNLTAADHVYILDPWWNPAVEEQAADRSHRIGQENPVLVHRLVAKGTVEESIQKLKEKKTTVAHSVLGDSQGDLGPLTREDLLELLEV